MNAILDIYIYEYTFIYIYTWPITNNPNLNLKLWRGWKKLLWVKLTTCPRNVTWRELKEKEEGKKKSFFFFSFSARRINEHNAVQPDCRATDCRTTVGRSVTSYCRTATRECVNLSTRGEYRLTEPFLCSLVGFMFLIPLRTISQFLCCTD